ncbi:hypothetical protein M8C21_015918, partial [Ambrosia artemisiifolia]
FSLRSHCRYGSELGINFHPPPLQYTENRERRPQQWRMLGNRLIGIWLSVVAQVITGAEMKLISKMFYKRQNVM